MNYRILLLEMIFYLPASQSLKDKRQLRQKLMSRLRNRWHLSIAETGAQDSIGRLELAAVLLCRNDQQAANAAEAILEASESIAAGEAELTEHHIDIL